MEGSREARDEYAGILGHHYAEAVRPEDADLAWAGADDELEELRRKALYWLERAADLAVRRYEIDDGVTLYHRALELTDDRRAQARIWHALGRAYAFKFDGLRFWDAMQKAIDLCDDATLRADLYADLALHTAGRIGMWPVLPESKALLGWIDRALELAPADSASRAKAFAARSMWGRAHGELSGGTDAVEASALAERLGNPELRVIARTCRVFSSYVDGDFEEALTVAQSSYELIDDVRDPDILTDIHATGTLPAVALGRFDEARRMAELHEEVASKLTSHHRVHGVAILAEVAEIAGRWTTIAELEPIIRERVSANLATPCIRNARTLLLSAIAAEYAGDREHSRELEESAREVQLEGYGTVLAGPEMRLALVRGDLERLETLVGVEARVSTWFGMGAMLARLDALSVLGDRATVEREATPLLHPGTLPEAFALRALGRVREDDELLRRALERFEAMGMDVPAAETRALLSGAA